MGDCSVGWQRTLVQPGSPLPTGSSSAGPSGLVNKAAVYVNVCRHLRACGLLPLPPPPLGVYSPGLRAGPLGMESEEAGPERDRGLPQGAQLLD